METDLEAVIRDRNIVLSLADIKSYIQMTLKGLDVCHKKWVLLRDMKTNNLLIGPAGKLKLAGFRLARIFGSPDRRFTHQDGPTMLSPPRKQRRVMPHREGFDVNAHNMVKMDDHGNETRPVTGERSENTPTSRFFGFGDEAAK